MITESSQSAKRQRIEPRPDASILVLQILFQRLLEAEQWRDAAALVVCSRDFLLLHRTDVWDAFWKLHSSKYPMIKDLLSFSLGDVKWHYFVNLEKALYDSGFHFNYVETRIRCSRPTKTPDSETRTDYKLGFHRYHGDYKDEFSFLSYDGVIRLNFTSTANRKVVKSSMNMVFTITLGWNWTNASNTAAISDERIHNWIVQQQCFHSGWTILTLPDG